MDIKYRTTRFVFGLFISLIALKSLSQQQFTPLCSLLKSNIKDFTSEEGLLSQIHFSFLSDNTNNFIKSSLSLNLIHDNSEDTIYFIYSLMFFGGIMCMFGQPLSKFFIVSSLILDLILLHNIKFFVSDSSKGLMLKYIAYLGGALHIA